MAVDAYVVFVPYNGQAPDSESQTDWSNNSADILGQVISPKYKTATVSGGKLTYGQIFEIEDYSFDIEQTLNIGSQGGGAGAGKVTFNPFSITRSIDAASPILFDMACSGTPFQTVYLALRKSVGVGQASAPGKQTAGFVFLRFDFKLVAVKTISWSHSDESPKETVTFEYGGLQIHYCTQNPDGSLQAEKVGGWNRVKNVQDHLATPL
ncbi:MAG TPA: type VI secretion system tube protein Hcp [Acetobacteraceae bacterium]|jgi:type VI secretion system secreted protein Hcp|nr:type VI secretion system tube protein Hcp [Acetobacteraceae bacterium]